MRNLDETYLLEGHFLEKGKRGNVLIELSFSCCSSEKHNSSMAISSVSENWRVHFAMKKSLNKADLKNWRRRGFYSETVLVKKLQRSGYNAVRVPVSNPSRHPLPDVIARKDKHVYAFEVKNANYYAYFPKNQIDKLFRFLDELIPISKRYKHAILAAHLGKKWIFRQIAWEDWEMEKLPEQQRILKRNKGNFKLEK